MPNALTLPSPGPLSIAAELAGLVDDANALAAESHAESTRRAYLSDFASFEAWCAARGLVSMPALPATVAVYVTALFKGRDGVKGKALATIERALAGIAHAHRARGFEWPRSEPTVAKVMVGIRRHLGRASTHQKSPVDDVELATLIATLDDGLVGRRDRAVLTMGWLGAFRRSELVGVTMADLTRTRAGLRILLRRSKTDQQGEGDFKAVPYASNADVCPVRALDEWLAASGITTGPIFRAIHRSGRILDGALGDRSVALIVQLRARGSTRRRSPATRFAPASQRPPP
jgi:integrase